MASTYPNIRLFVEASLHEGAMVALTEPQAHYLLSVMRQGEGAALAVFNGREGEWLARLHPVSRKKADIGIVRLIKPQIPAPDVWLLFAPIKHGRIDFLAEKATELGVTALWPVMTARTNVGRVNTARLQAHAVEAAEQCERMEVPPVHEPQALAALLAQWPQERLLLYGDESGGGLPPLELFERLPSAKAQWAVLVGPEGGFTPEEFDMLRRAPFAHAISLGPRVLRADTAALAALTCVMAWRGDWQQRPRFDAAGGDIAEA